MTVTDEHATEPEALLGDLSDATQRVIDLLGGCSDADAGVMVPGTSWSVGETAAHLATLWGRVLRDVRRSETAAATATLNAQCLEEYTERSPEAIAQQLSTDLGAGLAQLQAIPLDLEVPFHAGQMITIRSGLGVLVLEHAIHGADMAHALGRDLPVDESAIGRALRVLGGPVAGWLRDDAPDCELVLQLDDGGPPLILHIESGQLSTPASASADAAWSAPLPPFTVAMAWVRGALTGDPVVDSLPDLFQPI